ncbi:MAG: S46 family peptidase [Candidatus Cryptobacteroides sp.]
MKKFLLSLSLVAALLAGSAFSLKADEGMWLLQWLEKMNANQMKKMGCKLSPKQIYNADGISLKDAIVQFGGGCTGEMISDEGLLITNHHCGYSYIQALSSIEHNYLQDGFWAMRRSEELPCEGLSVKFLESITDVTEEVSAAEAQAQADYRDSTDVYVRVQDAIKAKKDELVSAAKEKYPDCEAQIFSFYNDNMLLLVIYKVYRDVRFVGAPPSSIGKFGADTDNWMWPRHTCDFSMFRVYAGADNEPADYSPENKPLQPKNHLKISLKGVKAGDYTMIMGYPGRTNRFGTSAELRQMLDQNDIRIEARTLRQTLMMEDMQADPKVKIQYASKYSGSSNGWKKWKGMKIAFRKLGVLERAEDEEAAFSVWADADPARKEKYSTALGDIRTAVEDTKKASDLATWLTETVFMSELSRMGGMAYSGIGNAREQGLDSAAVVKATIDFIRERDPYKDYSLSTDRKITEAMIRLYHEKTDTCDWIVPDYSKETVSDYVDRLFAESIFTSAEKAFEAIETQGTEAVYSDPATRLFTSIVRKLYSLRNSAMSYEQQLNRGRKAWAAGRMEWKAGEASYPDANFTMRLTYGKVMGYSPADAVEYDYFTTLDGVMEKDDPSSWEFAVPEKLKAIHAAKDFGAYADKDGKVHTCFLSNNDITGGNSGSPIMNAKGELIGLAFDGNWESMSSDIMFEPNLQRCINVDIRYVLLIIDKFGGASHLIDEMDIVR